MRSTAVPYTESRLARLVRNKHVGFPVVEHQRVYEDAGINPEPVFVNV